MKILFMLVLLLLGFFLIVLILIQRGKGGGLAGALGGMGGQSAFGTKAGDLFTRITIGVAALWIVVCVVSVLVLKNYGSQIQLTTEDNPPATSEAPATPGGNTTQPAPSTPVEKPAEQPASSK